MLQNISYYLIFGKPVIMYLGILAYILMITTATLGYLVTKGKTKFIYHKWFAISVIILVVIHAILGILLYF